MTENNEELRKIVREEIDSVMSKHINDMSEQMAQFQTDFLKFRNALQEKERKTASGAIDYIKSVAILTSMELGKHFPSFYNSAKFKKRIRELGEEEGIKFLELKGRGNPQLIVYRNCWEADQFVRLWTPIKKGIIFDSFSEEERKKMKTWLENCHLKEKFIVDFIKATLVISDKQ